MRRNRFIKALQCFRRIAEFLRDRRETVQRIRVAWLQLSKARVKNRDAVARSRSCFT